MWRYSPWGLRASVSMASIALRAIQPRGGRCRRFLRVSLCGRFTKPSTDFSVPCVPQRFTLRNSHSCVWLHRCHHAHAWVGSRVVAVG